MNFNKSHVSMNLWDGTLLNGYFKDSTFELGGSGTIYKSIKVFLTAGTYTISTSNQIRVIRTIIDGVWSTQNIPDASPYNFSVATDGYIGISIQATQNDTPWDSSTTIMLNSGSTALPYEPYSSEVWHDIPHYIHKTSTDTITTLPADIYPNDTTATVGLKGQTVQNSTPSPENPIIPQGTGERTENLAQWEKGGINTSTGANEAYRTKEQGGTCEQLRTQYIPCIADSTYVLSVNKYPVQSFISFYDENKNYLSRTPGYQQSGTRSFRADINAKYMRAQLAHVLEDHVYPAIEENAQFAITLGSTALPYEPYGYKLDISSASITTPIYLGEVETTRKIKKLVLNGTEDWDVEAQTNFFMNIIAGALKNKTVVCTHQLSTSTLAQGENCFISTSGRFNFTTSTIEHTAEAFKAYLAQQYAAGTPVCVWYVLATPETAVVNEPLMKIGDYADSISGITIPVTAGGDTLSVDTTVQPSEVTINYKGWHPVQNVHEKSKNLFDKSKRTDNSRVVYTTGEVGALSGVFVSDFTPIEPNTTYTLNIVSSISGKTGHLFALYDENKDFVNTGTHEATTATVYTFTTPSNVAYIRFNGDASSVDSTMLNEGSTALPHEPYWK